MPPRLRYIVYFLDFEMYTAHRAVLPAIARILVNVTLHDLHSL